MPGTSRSGRKRKPTELHKITGTYQKCRHQPKLGVVYANGQRSTENKNEDFKSPAPPSWLPKKQKELFNEVAKSIAHLKLPQPEQAEAFAQLIHSIYEVRRLILVLEKEPSGPGRKRLVVEYKLHQERCDRNSSRFGLTSG